MTWADRRRALGWYAAAIVGAAVFPRLAYWARWPTRLGLRGRIAYATINALFLFALRQFVVPRLNRMAEKWEQEVDQLREQLGHEPTEAELIDHLRRSFEA